MTGKIIAISGIYIVAGACLYFYLKKNKTAAPVKPVAPSIPVKSSPTTLNISNVALSTSSYCNPPISPTDPQRELRKFYYRKQMAEDAWNAQGRGMSLEFFMKEYSKQQGC